MMHYQIKIMYMDGPTQRAATVGVQRGVGPGQEGRAAEPLQLGLTAGGGCAIRCVAPPQRPIITLKYSSYIRLRISSRYILNIVYKL